MSLTDAELLQLRDLLTKPFERPDRREYLLRLAFPSALSRQSAISLKGASQEFAWRLIDHYYCSDHNALLTILNVIQDEEGGDLARALQPFVDKLVQSGLPSLSAPVHGASPLVTISPLKLQNYQAILENAIALNYSGNYEAALPLLEQLKAAGYKPEIVEPHLRAAQDSIQWEQLLRAGEEARRQRLAALREAYGDIALLARSQATLREAWQKWNAFQKEYPEWYEVLEGDPDDLCTRFPSAFTALRSLKGYTKDVIYVEWLPNGRALASGAGSRLICLWDVETGQPLVSLRGHTQEALSVAWSPDGRRIASGSKDGTIHLWEARTGQLLWTLTGDKGDVLSVAWSPDGRFVASGGCDRLVRLWDAAKGQLLGLFAGHTKGVYSVAWSPDGRRIASASSDGTIRLWNAERGQFLRTLLGHTGGVCDVAWSPDGSRLASGSWDCTVRLWDAERERPLQTFRGHMDWVYFVGWSPDGRVLASASRDKTIRLWNAQKGQLLHVLRGHTDSVNSAAWSPNGRYLASGSSDNTIIIWGIP